MTEEGLKRFNRNVSGYRLFADRDQLSAYAVAGYTHLPPAVRQYMQISGAYNRKTRELELDGSDRIAGIAFSTQDRYGHEFGHAIDGPSFELSGQREWQDAWRAEIKPNPPNPNAATNAHEGFVAFSAMIYGSGANRTGLSRSQRLCVTFWGSIGLW